MMSFASSDTRMGSADATAATTNVIAKARSAFN